MIDFDLSIWPCEDLSSYQTITFLLQSECLNHLRLTALASTVYLSYLPNPTLSHRLSCVRWSKCIRNERCFIFSTRDLEKNNKKHFHSIEIENDILLYISIKQVFRKLITHAASVTLKSWTRLLNKCMYAVTII